MKGLLRIAAVTVFSLGSVAASVLYGGLGGHAVTSGPLASANDGALGIVSQTTGSVTIVGHPAGVSRITGLAFDSAGDLFASTVGGTPFPPPPGALPSNLLELNPANGLAMVNVPITAGGVQLSIADLALQPGTNILFGVTSPHGAVAPGQLYTINTATGVATAVGTPQAFFDSIAFAPNGTLYEAVADFAGAGPINPRIQILNPSTGARVGGAVSTSQFFGALAVRPEDSLLFGGTGDESGLYTINASTGAATLIGDTGLNFVGDFAFAPVPEPGEAGAVVAALSLLWLARRRAGAAHFCKKKLPTNIASIPEE